MGKKESTIMNMVATLFTVTIISSAALGFVHNLTEKPVDDAKNAKIEIAVKRVLSLPVSDNPTVDSCRIESADGGDKLICYSVSKDGEFTGFAVETWTMKGFSGLIRLMAGFSKSGDIINISVLEQKETPGLGTKINDAEFKDQYSGKNPRNFKLAVKKDGGDVDAITAATISSRAFSDAVERAYKSLEKAGKLGQ
jgi:electron transport complex protein RnfG